VLGFTTHTGSISGCDFEGFAAFAPRFKCEHIPNLSITLDICAFYVVFVQPLLIRSLVDETHFVRKVSRCDYSFQRNTLTVCDYQEALPGQGWIAYCCMTLN